MDVRGLYKDNIFKAIKEKKLSDHILVYIQQNYFFKRQNKDIPKN